ncbi:MAG: ceramidase domain-containing protein [Deltaproteobacteria bacterium]
MAVTPLEPGCPWYELSSWALPNINWCEAPRCAWIVEPANTWSNLAFFILALFVWKRARGRDPRLAWFAPAAVLLGAASFIYHASYTFFFQFFDFLGMFVFIGITLTLNAQRMGLLKRSSQLRALGWGVTAGCLLVIALYLLGIPIQGIVFVLMLTLIGSELRLMRSPQRAPDYRFFYLMLAIMALASAFSVLDVSRVLCDPENHFFQGHATWHVLSSLGLATGYLFYEKVLED